MIPFEAQLITCVFLELAPKVLGWQYFTSLKDIEMSNSAKDEEVMHSEYHYGTCRSTELKGLILMLHKHLDHMDVLGKLIIREWIVIHRIPKCIILRATAYVENTFRNSGYNFQMCVPRITYCHSQHRFKYFYYEWYLPYDISGGMNWDILFYGPEDDFWH